jgi:transposase
VESTPEKPYKKAPAHQEAFTREMVPKLEALAIPAEKRVPVWVEDEHRYGLISGIRRYWTLKGQRPTVPYQTKFQWGYVYGALDVVTGQAAFLYTPTVALAWTEAYLQELIARAPEAMPIMLWDRAGFHLPAESPELPEAVRVLPLPAYSPELNPIESLWDPVKRRIANAVWETLENIEAAISEVVEPVWQHLEQVQSLLGDSWLTRGVSTFLDRRKKLIPP